MMKCKCGQQYLEWNMVDYKAKMYCYKCGHNRNIEIPNHIPQIQWVKYVGGVLK